MAIRHFKTNVLLKSIIGKDLINNDNIAILELVKNAFDAGSKKVSVEFRNIINNDDISNDSYGNSSSRVIIQDQGCGMSFDEVENRWLNIAYSDKRLNTTAHGRVMAGAKGIGRFSCDRLGTFLDLYTRKPSGKIVHLHVDWRKFEIEGDPDKLIESVNVDLKHLTNIEFSKKKLGLLNKGTIVCISKLRSLWNEDKLLSLRRYLERLVNPNQTFSKSSFTLVLQAKEFGNSVNGVIQNRIFSRLDFTSTSIEAEISPDGTTITTTLRDRGRDVFELVEKNLKCPLLKGVRATVYYLNPYGKGYFKRMTGMDKVQFGSIFLFINGFRIPPYGDEKDDWLGLDRHKAQGTRRFLGTREVVGRIEVDDFQGRYKIVSSREGIVQDDRFEQITNRPDGFYYLTHRRLERFVVEGLDWDRAPEEHVKELLQNTNHKSWVFDPKDEIYSQTESEKNLRILEMLDRAISTKKENIIRLTINPELILELSKVEQERAERILDSFEDITPQFGRSTTGAFELLKRTFARQKKKIERLKKREAELENRLADTERDKTQLVKQNLFLKAASTAEDRGMGGLQHQIGISSDAIRRKVRELAKAIEKQRPSEELMIFVKAIGFENRKIHAVSRYATQATFSMVDKSIHNDLVAFIQQYVRQVFIDLPENKLSGSKMDIEIMEGGELTFETKFSPLDIIIVVDNLLDNSRKALANKVGISFFRKGERSLEIRIRDNGMGVDHNNVGKIFDYGFTTTAGGSGIGLHHARQILSRTGNIEFVQPEKKGAEFVITINR